MRRSRRQLCTLLFASTLWCAAPDARASPGDDSVRAKARTLGYAGVESYAGGDYATASAKLEESFQLLPVPSLGLWSARALAQLGKLLQAEERYRRVASLPLQDGDPPAQHAAKADAAREHLELLAKIPSLEIQLSGAGAEQVIVTVDGAVRAASLLPVALLVDPGRHEVVGTRGAERSAVVLNLRDGAHEKVELRFREVPPTPELASNLPASSLPAPSPPVNPTRSVLRTGAWVALGAGAAGLTTSLVAYLMARDQYDGFERRDLCVNGGCSQDEVDTYNTLRSVQLVTLIGGAISCAAGASVLILTWPASAESPRDVALRLGPGSASLVGSF